MGISYAGIDLLVETPEVQQFIAQNLPLDELNHLARPIPRSPEINYPPPPPIGINRLYWPTGAQRWGTFYGLATTVQKQKIVDAMATATLPPTDTGNTSDLVITSEERVGKGRAAKLIVPMYLLPARPISCTLANLWLIPLVDQRYWWQFTQTDDLSVTASTTWADLYSTLAAQLSTTITVDAVDPDYLSPDINLTERKYSNVPSLLDAAAHSVAQRIVVDTDGSIKAMGWDSAQSQLDTNRTGPNRSWHQIAGGAFDDEHRRAPNQVVISFQKIYDHVPDHQGDRYAIALEAYVLNFTSQQILAGTSKYIWSNVYADFTSGSATPDNNTAIVTFTSQIASDYYESLKHQYDVSYAALALWTPQSYDDSIMWSVASLGKTGQLQCSTRVQSSPINLDIEHHLHYDPSIVVLQPNQIGRLDGSLSVGGSVDCTIYQGDSTRNPNTEAPMSPTVQVTAFDFLNDAIPSGSRVKLDYHHESRRWYPDCVCNDGDESSSSSSGNESSSSSSQSLSSTSLSSQSSSSSSVTSSSSSSESSSSESSSSLSESSSSSSELISSSTEQIGLDTSSASSLGVSTSSSSGAAQLAQFAFRGRADDGNEAAANWLEAKNVNWLQAPGENFRVRFQLDEQNALGENATRFRLQRNLNGSGWVAVTSSSSVVKSFDSTHYAEGDDTTQQVGSGTYNANNNGMTEALARTGQMDFAASSSAELEFCLQLVSASIANGDEVQLRVVRDDTSALDVYTNIPTVTMDVEQSSSSSSSSLGTSSSSVSSSSSSLGVSSSSSLSDSSQSSSPSSLGISSSSSSLGTSSSSSSSLGTSSESSESSSSFGGLPSLCQEAFRGRNDDGNEAGATWVASKNSNWTQTSDNKFRVRFLIQEQQGAAHDATQLQLQYKLNSGSWLNVTASSPIRPAESANYIGFADTTQQLGSGTYVTDNDGMIESTGRTNNKPAWSGSDELEIEFCLTINSGQVSDSDQIQLRLVRV